MHAQFLLQFKHLVHQLDVAGLVFGGVHGDGAALVDGEFFAQFRYGLVVCGVGFLVGSGERDVEGGLAAAVFGVAEEGEGVLGCLFEVAEAHDVAGGLERVEDSVGAAVCLHQAVHLQVLVDPEGVDGLGVEAGEEHVDDDEQVQFTHLHLAGDVLVVVVEGVAVGAEVGAEHGVVVFEEAVHAAAGAFGGEGEVFFFAEGVEELPAVALRVDDGDLELLFGAQGTVCDAFFLQGVEGVVVGAGSINRRGCQDRVEAAHALYVVFGDAVDGAGLFDLVAGGCALVGFAVVVVQDVGGYGFDTFGAFEYFLALCELLEFLRVGGFGAFGGNFFCVGGFFEFGEVGAGVGVFQVEFQHVLVVDGVNDGVGVQAVAEDFDGGGAGAACGVLFEDGGASEPEHAVLLEVLLDGGVHAAELGAVTFVEDDGYALAVDGVFRFGGDEVGQLVDGGDHDVGSAVGEAVAEFAGAAGGADGVCLEVVVFEHGLVVEVFAVHDEDDLVDESGFCQAACGFEAGEGFAAAGGVPDVAAGFFGAEEFGVVVGDFDSLNDFFGCRDLVGAHDEQVLAYGEDAVAGQDVCEGVAGEEGAREED